MWDEEGLEPLGGAARTLSSNTTHHMGSFDSDLNSIVSPSKQTSAGGGGQMISGSGFVSVRQKWVKDGELGSVTNQQMVWFQSTNSNWKKLVVTDRTRTSKLLLTVRSSLSSASPGLPGGGALAPSCVHTGYYS